MSLDNSYLEYPYRKKGMDHDLYPASNLFTRKAVHWPEGKSIALWITVSLEFFPLTPNDGPFKAPGSMVTPFPDLRTFTTKDYGNRVGIYRIIKVLDSLSLTATAFMSSDLTTRYPALLADVQKEGWEIGCLGQNMNHIHYGGMDEAQERSQIENAVEALEKACGMKPAGWISPARSQSENTLRLLAEAGLAYNCDWGNDDMPYDMTLSSQKITAMPYTDELEDRKLFVELGHREASYEAQILDSFEWLKQEAAKTKSGRILHLALTPYVIGQPFRIASLKAVLEKISNDPMVWNAAGADIHVSWLGQS